LNLQNSAGERLSQKASQPLSCSFLPLSRLNNGASQKEAANFTYTRRQEQLNFWLLRDPLTVLQFTCPTVYKGGCFHWSREKRAPAVMQGATGSDNDGRRISDRAVHLFEVMGRIHGGTSLVIVFGGSPPQV